MIQKLRIRLTLLMATMTALVLAGALLVTWKLSEEQYQTSAEALFDNNFSALCDRLIDAASVTDTWLTEQERSTGYWLFLQDNGASLHYAGSLYGKTPREELEKLACAEARLCLDFTRKDDSGRILRQEAHFTMDGTAGDSYFGAGALLPRGTNGEYLLVVSLQDSVFLTQHFLVSALQYGGLWLAGSLFLVLISYWLAGMALAPTAQALRRQKEFIAAASHELRSPLAVIKASLQAIGDNPVSDRKDVLLHSAQSETDRMVHLTDDLLLLANGDLENMPTNLELLAPDNLCIEMYDQFYLLAQQSGHSLSLLLPDGPVNRIQANEERLRQLLSILLRNAIEHTPKGCTIQIVLAGGTDREPVSISVIDHGPGIPDDAKKHIFERFYRADASRTNKLNFGLGLSVAQELARLHGASLKVQDTPGGGATFVLRFPQR